MIKRLTRQETFNEVIEMMSERLRRANERARDCYKREDKEMYEWYLGRALELEYTLNDVKEMAGIKNEEAA